MSDYENILKQARLSQEAVAEIRRQSAIFEKTLVETLKNAPEADKKAIQEIQSMSMKVIQLAKEGKNEEAQELIKQFGNGKNN